MEKLFMNTYNPDIKPKKINKLLFVDKFDRAFFISRLPGLIAYDGSGLEREAYDYRLKKFAASCPTGYIQQIDMLCNAIVAARKNIDDLSVMLKGFKHLVDCNYELTTKKYGVAERREIIKNHKIEQIKTLASQNCTTQEIADQIHSSCNTVLRYKHQLGLPIRKHAAHDKP
jgi:hypothetical protein